MMPEHLWGESDGRVRRCILCGKKDHHRLRSLAVSLADMIDKLGGEPTPAKLEEPVGCPGPR